MSINEKGIIINVTTNPSLLSKKKSLGQKPAYLICILICIFIFAPGSPFFLHKVLNHCSKCILISGAPQPHSLAIKLANICSCLWVRCLSTVYLSPSLHLNIYALYNPAEKTPESGKACVFLPQLLFAFGALHGLF